MKVKHIAIACTGNIIEWFDFAIFISFAPILGKVYFPMTNSKFSTLAAFFVFVTGYICRPLGGILFGFFGDTAGRVKSLQSSILMMSFTTFIISILPGEKTIGVAAPIIFVLTRMLQGISTGGEYCGIMIYLAESAVFSRRGLVTSFAGSGANLGFLLATLVIILFNNLFSVDFLNAWGWRIPFSLLGLFGVIIFISRFQLTETPVYQSLRLNHAIHQKPLLAAMRSSPKNLLKIFFLTCLSSTFYIVLLTYAPEAASKISGATFLSAPHIQSLLLITMLLFLPCGGFLGDRIGRKKMLMGIYVLIILLAYPLFYLLNSQHAFLILSVLLASAILSALDQGSNLAAFVENCPSNIRYSGLGFAYNTGNAIFGGIAPLMTNLLINFGNPLAPAYYLIICGVMTLPAILTLLPKYVLEMDKI